MSLGSMPQQRKVSDSQFVGDLMGLFRRHRIGPAGAGGMAEFESNLALKDNFRSQLFTLCTAISHMADEDLSGEELLGLIGRAMGVAGGDPAAKFPDGIRSAFLSGYASWNNRDLSGQDVWPPERRPIVAHGPIPFPEHTEPLPEPEHGLRVPGLPTVQEALLMAKKQAPFELPARAAALPEAQRSEPGPVALGGRSPQSSANVGVPVVALNIEKPTAAGNIENLTISELTQLLEDIERRMSRIKPQMHELNALIRSPSDRPDPSDRKQNEEVAKIGAIGPTLVPQKIDLALPPVDSSHPSEQYAENDPFVARHTYLNPNSRRRVSLAPPAPLVVAPVPPPPPILEAIVVPVDPSDRAATTQLSVVPRGPAGFLAQYKNIDAAMADHSDSYRVLIHIAIGVLAAVILVAIPLAAVMLYRSSHVRYEYHNLQPAAQPAMSAPPGASAGVGPGSQPAANGAISQPISPASSQKAKSRTTKHKPPLPVEVWPPPPSR